MITAKRNTDKLLSVHMLRFGATANYGIKEMLKD
jgi:hypothetical protein